MPGSIRAEDVIGANGDKDFVTLAVEVFALPPIGELLAHSGINWPRDSRD